MTDHIEKFIDFMRQNNLGPDDPSCVVDDDQPHYYQIEGDRRGQKKASYCLSHDGDGFAFGWIYNHRLGESISWHTKSSKKWSDDEKQAHKAKLDALKKHRAERDAEMRQAARDDARAKWDRASRDGSSEYLDRKQVTIPGVRFCDGNIIVPAWRDGELVAVQEIRPDGFKLFQSGSDHMGGYFSIRGSLDTIAVGEGVATMAAVHMATGWSSVAAFNAGNLKTVAIAMRSKYPDARIVITADNDHELAERHPEIGNVGLVKAGQAAVAIGGAQVICPDSEPGVTDWNDVLVNHGVDAVREKLTRVPVIEQWEPDEAPEVIEHNDPLDIVRPLGHNRGKYYFFPRSTGQVMSFDATALARPANLYQLATRSFWEAMYAPEDKMSVIADYAAAQLIDECHRKGVFSLEDARGVGVWRDRGGKLLVNCGNVIVGEGVRCHPAEYGGDFVYEAGQRVIDMDTEPLSVGDAAKFRSICKKLTWRRPQYGDFLAGWCVIAGVGGAVDWRPHIFITGPKGSGKSTAMDKVVMGALHGIAVKRDGGTTEPGIRKAIGASSRPFIMDEAEAESGNRRTQMQLIFEYFRNASSGAVVENAYASYVARSAACFGAINPRIEQGADVDRWSVLELMPNTATDRDAHYKTLLKDIREVITNDFPHRLLVRTVANLDVLLYNIGIFVDVFSKKLGSKRAGDQVGTLIAGSYSLTSSKRVTYEFVEEWVDRQNWEWEELKGGRSDAETMVAHIMSARVRYDHDGMGRESSLGELIWRAKNQDHIGSESAVKGLGLIGIMVEGDRLIISNTAPRLKEILKETPWGADWKRPLGDFKGADNCDGRVVYFGPGVKSRAMSIPLAAALGDDGIDAGDDFEMEGFE